MYKVIRFYFNGGSRTVRSGLTLQQAQDHCGLAESSSRTCQGSKAKARTKSRGPWFDGYDTIKTG